MKAQMKKEDREIILESVDGKPTSVTGMVDTRLFKGGNTLHGIMDPQTCLWYLKQDHGILPEPLRQRFTSFQKLKAYAETYYNKRNIVIKEVID